jgi:hypothetical protein
VIECVASGVCFGVFFTGALTDAEWFIEPEDAGDKFFAVIGAALIEHFVAWAGGTGGLENFLEASFWIQVFVIEVEGGDFLMAQVHDDGGSGLDVGVHVDGTDEGFDGIGEGGGTFSATGGGLAFAHEQVGTEVDAQGVSFQGGPGDQLGAEFGQSTFVQLRKEQEDFPGQDELQHGIAEELESLVIEVRTVGLVRETRVCQGLS